MKLDVSFIASVGDIRREPSKPCGSIGGSWRESNDGLAMRCGSSSLQSGQVLDSSGRPIARATVLVYHAGVKVGYSTYCPSCYRDCGKRVTADQNGEFVVRDLAPDLWFTLLAVHEGYVPKISEKLDPDKTPGFKIVLAPRSSTSETSSVGRGKITDLAGSPVRDAIVQPIGLILGQSSTYGTIDGLDPMAVTNDQGDFELSYTGNSPAMLVEIEGRGYAPKFAKLATGATRTTLKVSDGAAIRGILTANGKPVGNAEVGLIAKDRGGYQDNLAIIGFPYDEQRVGTGPDGSFLFTNVPEPVTWLLYGKMNSMPRGEGTQPVEIRTDQDKQFLDKVQLVADPAHTVTGKIILSDGHPIPEGMRLIFGSDRIWDSQTVTLGRNGAFEINNVPNGDFCISPSVKGYEAKNLPNSSCDVPIRIAGGDKRDVVVILYPKSKS